MVNALISLDNATDAYPRAKWVLKRVQRAYEILGHSSMVCAYRVARQSLEKQKATLNIQDCPLISDVKTLAIPAQPNTFVSEVEERRQKGELRVDLSWDGQADLDLFVVEPRGRMLWWLSPRRNIRHFGVVGSGPEHIEMPTLPDGTWRVYALRRAGSTGEVNATVTVNARGTKKTLKFAILDGETKAIAEVVATTKRVKVSGPTRAKFNFHISTPDGPVKKSTIQKVFRRRRATLVHCFDRVHSPYSGRRFHTELEIDLSKSGRVSSADLVPSKSVPNREISECMRRKIKRFRFPSGDAETTFRIKLKARSAQ
jgi:hypothetical protein